MMEKITQAELRVMEVLWKNGEQTAAEIARTLQNETGWNNNTTYTLLKRCIEKGVIQRTDPGFRCRALMKREDMQRMEMHTLLTKLFDGSRELFFASMLGGQKLTHTEIERLQAMLDAAKEGESEP